MFCQINNNFNFNFVPTSRHCRLFLFFSGVENTHLVFFWKSYKVEEIKNYENFMVFGDGTAAKSCKFLKQFVIGFPNTMHEHDT